MMMTLLNIVFLLLFTASEPAHAQVAIIVHPSVQVQGLDRSDVLGIYSLKTREWTDDGRVVPITMKGNGPVVTRFHEYLGRSALKMTSDWMRIQLLGEGRAPLALSSEEEVIAKVQATPGAIGYVSMEKAKAASGIRIVAIIG